MQEIFTRASHRSYLDTPIEEEKVRRILEAAMAAPTAKNQRAWEFFVVTNKEVLQKLGEVSPYSWPAAKANIAIVIAYREEGAKEPQLLDVDCAIAAENILLEITHLGLAGLMIGIAPTPDRMQKVAEAIGLPDDLKAFTIIPFGYPKKEKPQKDRYVEEKVHWVK